MAAGTKYPGRNPGEAWCCEGNWEKASWPAPGTSMATHSCQLSN